MRLREWLSSLPADAMISGFGDKLSFKPDGKLKCTSHWWTPSEAMNDFSHEDLQAHGMNFVLGIPEKRSMNCWAARLSVGIYSPMWSVLQIPGKGRGS